LLMSSARAFLRQRASMGGSILEIVTDVNRQLAEDVEDFRDRRKKKEDDITLVVVKVKAA